MTGTVRIALPEDKESRSAARNEQPFRKLLVLWGGCVGATGLTAAVLELGFTRLHAAFITSDTLGAVHALLFLWLVFSLAAVPFALMGLGYDR